MDGRTLTLAPSGWTYKRTFVLYDRETGSLWYPQKGGLMGIQGGVFQESASQTIVFGHALVEMEKETSVDQADEIVAPRRIRLIVFQSVWIKATLVGPEHLPRVVRTSHEGTRSHFLESRFQGKCSPASELFRGDELGHR